MGNRIGEILVRERRITLEQLRKAQEASRTEKTSLGHQLARSGLMSDKDMTDFLSQHYRVRSIDLDEHGIAEDVKSLIAHEVCVRHTVVPVSRAGNAIILAMADPSNLHAIDDIKFLTGCDVQPVVAAELQIIRTLAEAAPPLDVACDIAEPVVRATAPSPGTTSGAAGSCFELYDGALDAYEARIAAVRADVAAGQRVHRECVAAHTAFGKAKAASIQPISTPRSDIGRRFSATLRSASGDLAQLSAWAEVANRVHGQLMPPVFAALERLETAQSEEATQTLERCVRDLRALAKLPAEPQLASAQTIEATFLRSQAALGELSKARSSALAEAEHRLRKAQTQLGELRTRAQGEQNAVQSLQSGALFDALKWAGGAFFMVAPVSCCVTDCASGGLRWHEGAALYGGGAFALVLALAYLVASHEAGVGAKKAELAATREQIHDAEAERDAADEAANRARESASETEVVRSIG